MKNFDPKDFEHIRKIALEFPNASDSLSHYDTPSVKIKKHLLCRLDEDGTHVVIRTDFESRANFLEHFPECCFITTHLGNYPYICLYLNTFSMDLAKTILQSGYQAIISKRK